jgi:hypothetical protein
LPLQRLGTANVPVTSASAAAAAAAAADNLLIWGWRIPFLMAVVTLIAAVILRYNMPER